MGGLFRDGFRQSFLLSFVFVSIRRRRARGEGGRRIPASYEAGQIGIVTRWRKGVIVVVGCDRREGES